MKKQNRSFIRIDEKELTKSTTVEVITLTSDSTKSSPLKVYTSDNQFDFMVTSQDCPDITATFTSKISNPKIDKAVKKIQELNATPMPNKSPIEFKTAPCGTASIKVTSPENIHHPEKKTNPNLTYKRESNNN